MEKDEGWKKDWENWFFSLYRAEKKGPKSIKNALIFFLTLKVLTKFC